MKRNVDLTENMIFTSNLVTNISISNIINNKEMPWSRSMKLLKSDDDMDLDHQRRSVIAVGNKATRAQVKYYREMDSLDYCDCCGKRMNLKPWDREIGICHQCNNDMYVKNTDKCKWRKNNMWEVR